VLVLVLWTWDFVLWFRACRDEWFFAHRAVRNVRGQPQHAVVDTQHTMWHLIHPSLQASCFFLTALFVACAPPCAVLWCVQAAVSPSVASPLTTAAWAPYLTVLKGVKTLLSTLADSFNGPLGVVSGAVDVVSWECICREASSGGSSYNSHKLELAGCWGLEMHIGQTQRHRRRGPCHSKRPDCLCDLCMRPHPIPQTLCTHRPLMPPTTCWALPLAASST
jgi:hypothetical protein